MSKRKQPCHLGVIPYTSGDDLQACFEKQLKKDDADAFDVSEYFGKTRNNQASAVAIVRFAPCLVALAQVQPKFRFKLVALREALAAVQTSPKHKHTPGAIS